MKPSQIKKIIDRLPHAFDYKYWNMADTTYKEEVFLAIIEGLNISQAEALKLQSSVFPKNKLLRKILKEEVVECMGGYGKEYIGTSFFGTYTNKYNGRGQGITRIINTPK